MRETGTVIKTDDKHVFVEMKSKGGCKSCEMAAVCHSTGTGKRELQLPLSGRSYQPGQPVDIETPARSLLTASFLVFILPLILSFITYLIVASKTNSTGKGILAFFICFIITEILIAVFDRTLGKKQYFSPRIVHSNDRL